MKKLMFLISTKGKTREQIQQEAWDAYQKFQAESQKAAAEVQAQQGSAEKVKVAESREEPS